MKRQSNASLSILKDSPANKVIYGYHMVDSLNKNASAFVNLPVANADLKKLTDELASAGSEAKSGDHTAVARLINGDKAWDASFKKTINYISTIANGNEETIRMGGAIPTQNESHPAALPGQAANYSVKIHDGKGVFDASCDSMHHTADAFVYVAAPDGVHVTMGNNMVSITIGEKTVYLVVDTHRQHMFQNVPSKQTLNVQMYAVNSAGSGPMTDPKEITPQ